MCANNKLVPTKIQPQRVPEMSFIGLLAPAALAAGLALGASAEASAGGLDSAPAQATVSAATFGFDGVVEAVRQAVIAAQVSGAIVELDAAVGDRVQAGQVLLRIDARAAEQNAVAGDAQVQSARASLDAATQELERQRQLFAKNYISQAALQRAEATFKAARAQVEAQG